MGYGQKSITRPRRGGDGETIKTTKIGLEHTIHSISDGFEPVIPGNKGVEDVLTSSTLIIPENSNRAGAILALCDCGGAVKTVNLGLGAIAISEQGIPITINSPKQEFSPANGLVFTGDIFGIADGATTKVSWQEFLKAP